MRILLVLQEVSESLFLKIPLPMLQPGAVPLSRALPTTVPTLSPVPVDPAEFLVTTQ